ncbi:MAG TPA: hypothetical protein VEB40_03735 [Flavipsychrobacter sp.]|nr:hypothetical protein [Flavipsychrobacter sp.]
MRLLLTAIGCFIILGLHGCSEDFTVAAPYKQVTVVAGILDMKDTAHYIRIQKAFMDEHKSAIEMSKEPDSSFYRDLEVKLYEYDSAQVKVLDSVVLFRVDLNQEGYRKKDPINDQQFFTSPHHAYKFTNTQWAARSHMLSPRLWYRLTINNKQTGHIDSSDFVGIVNSDSNRTFEGLYVQEFQLTNYIIDFSKTTAISQYKLSPFLPRNGRMLEGYIRFHYVERNVVTRDTVRKQVDYAFDNEMNAQTVGARAELQTLNSNIYGFLNSAIGPAPANIERLMDSCDVFVYAASPEIYYYTIINQGQTGTITSDNIQPNYTNFKGTDVIGVLGSRGMRSYYGASISKVTIDSLRESPVTASLRITGVSED